ncbi:hypothetical protein OSB04_012455 [Centaurea solstitialis]|uniref:Gag protein n=1 Tax=Centaurea solstitialis TaxID=347529 RepID=A0AA38WQN7_9ASTR|nr:hypothetical protein OSB04_012455 [Centaurea solstitialis]
MAANSNSSFMSIGSQSKPPTLNREEFQQWKIRMISFLEEIHPRITEYLHNPPYIPVKLIPRVPATSTTLEIPEYYQPKPQTDWDEEEKEFFGLAPKCKRLLIMALPNDIFEYLDHRGTSMGLWAELLKQLEGGVKTLKNYRTVCINEYNEFMAKEGESLKDTNYRFNILIIKCRRSGVIRTNEDNNMLFLKSLGAERLHLTMSMRTTLDLESISLADLYGSFASQESLVMQIKSSIGGPLALVAEGSKGKGKEVKTEAKKKKKKALMIVKDDEDVSSKEEISVKDMMKTLVLFTKEYRRRSSGRGRGKEYSKRRGEAERRREYERRGGVDRRGDYGIREYERRDADKREWNNKEELRGEP